MRSLVVLSIMLFCGSAGAVNYPPDRTDEMPPSLGIDVTPINSSYLHRTAVSQPPLLNPLPYPVQVGDELTQVAYTDRFGMLYDVQANLTKRVAKIFREGRLIGTRSMTLAEVEEFRRAGRSGGGPQAAKCEALCVALVAAVVSGVVTVVYDQYQDRRECQRAHMRAVNDQVAQALQCARDGGEYVIHQMAQPDLCGGGAYGTCQK